MPTRKKTLNNSDVEITYEYCGSVVEKIKGKFHGVQLMLAEDTVFVLIEKEDKVERFIPVNRIIHIDIFKAEYAKEMIENDDKSYIE